MGLIETSSADIVRSPWGRYTTTGNSVVWCASRTLSGAHLWGSPNADETGAITRLFEEYPQVMDARFDMILDTRAVETIDLTALDVLTRWMWTHRDMLLERARVTSIVREGPTGFLLAGLLPTIANSPAFRVVTDPKGAFRTVLGDAGPALAEEIDAIASRLRGVPHELQIVRALLGERVDATIDDAVKRTRMSVRSLQRLLARHGTSFHDEVVVARMRVARQLLLTTDLKVAAIARRLGISERAITLLFRAQTGLTPIEWRDRQRATA